MRRSVTDVLVSRLLLLSVFAASFAAAFSTARGYNDYDQLCGWTYPGGYNYLYLPYMNDPDYPPYGYYTSMLSSAVTTWNNAATPVVFYSSSAAHTVGVKNLGPGPGGVLVATCLGSGGTRSSSALYLNSYYIGNTSGQVFYGTGVASHELGHYLGLGHSWYTAIMGVNDGSFNTPRTDDLCGVNVIYPNSFYAPTCGY